MKYPTVEDLNWFELLSMLVNIAGGKLQSSQREKLIDLCQRHQELDRLAPFALGDDARLAFLVAQVAILRAQASSRNAMLRI
ncbi:hypothetical protein [Paraburkholderia sp. J12]|uniref:hypothetical protein n=1 Tax=Paraburkholderia sp. J12 TaxID=2805432 RepID=UPI002ABD766E|nr:hypothetical protein [Paraburkholderia sp. J12]